MTFFGCSDLCNILVNLHKFLEEHITVFWGQIIIQKEYYTTLLRSSKRLPKHESWCPWRSIATFYFLIKIIRFTKFVRTIFHWLDFAFKAMITFRSDYIR